MGEVYGRETKRDDDNTTDSSLVSRYLEGGLLNSPGELREKSIPPHLWIDGELHSGTHDSPIFHLLTTRRKKA